MTSELQENIEYAIQQYAYILLGMLHLGCKSIKKFMEIININFRIIVTWEQWLGLVIMAGYGKGFNYIANIFKLVDGPWMFIIIHNIVALYVSEI